MTPDDSQRIQAFIEKWQPSEGNEQANSQPFFLDLCAALGVDGPPPKDSSGSDTYSFEKAIKAFSAKGQSSKRADFYKEGCFLLEAKQGSFSSNKGHGKRGTKIYEDEMQGAFNQARQYIQLIDSPTKPPFLITCDIGYRFDIWEGFSGEYGSYGARERIDLADLAQEKVFDRFVAIFTDPQSLNPERQRAEVTRKVAAELALLSRWLEEQGHDPQVTASFLMRCIFTMFAEDVEMLKGEVFTTMLRERWIPDPSIFKSEIEDLWQVMNTGGKLFGHGRILKFNGSFFEDATAIALPKEQLEILLEAAEKGWENVEPAIFGTLLERALEKKERSRLGAHYTPRSYVERLVRPVVMEPLRQEWDEIELEIKRLMQPTKANPEPTTKQRNAAGKEIQGFLKKLRSIRVLDPACGTGNFLYVSLDLMKALESEVLTRLEDVTGQSRDQIMLDIEQVQINPSQFLGIELNPRAAAIAELVIWIGYLQWQFRQRKGTGFIEPVLQAFGNIENRDAVLAYKKEDRIPDVDPKTGQARMRWGGRMMHHPVTGEEIFDLSDQVVVYKYLNVRSAEWPRADYVVSNPPFIGTKRVREILGDEYAKPLRKIYSDLPETIDYVMYWWHLCAQKLSDKELLGFGLITTNSIKQVENRKVIQKHIQKNEKFKFNFAIPDHPWVDDGAAVRISMTSCCLSGSKAGSLWTIANEDSDGTPEEKAEQLSLKKIDGEILFDLRIGANISEMTPLLANSKICNQGCKLVQPRRKKGEPKNKGFLISRLEATEMTRNFAEGNSHIKPYISGDEITDSREDLFVIDFFGLSAKEAQEANLNAYQRILEQVKPFRDGNNRPTRRENWWLFGELAVRMRQSYKNLSRYIVTSEVSKHRTFLFVSSEVLADGSCFAFGLDDSYHLGVLSSRVHTTLALAAGGRMATGNTPRYNNTVCFTPFPFPDPTPEQKQKIRDLGERLDAHRKSVQAAHPDITITGMYNLLEKLRAGQPFTDADRAYNNRALVSTLKQIHDDLDLAVLDAYGWPHTITDEQILENLVALNAQCAEEERNGHIRWLRPDYQAPEQAQTTQPTLDGILPAETPVVAPVEQQPWPSQPKAQLAAIRDLLRTSTGQWTVPQIAAQFTGKNTKKKLDAITANLERLEWFGYVIASTDNGLTTWHYTELAKAA